MVVSFGCGCGCSIEMAIGATSLFRREIAKVSNQMARVLSLSSSIKISVQQQLASKSSDAGAFAGLSPWTLCRAFGSTKQSRPR